MSRSRNKNNQAKNRELKRKLAALQKIGAYNPTSRELTPSRLRAINTKYNIYKAEIENKNSLFIKFPSYASAQKLRSKANSLKFKTTKKGLFIDKEGSRRGSIEFNSELGEYQIKLTGKTKYGKRAGTRITKYFPLSNMSELDSQRERFKNEFDNLNRGKKEYARIRVTETGNDGFSRSIFSDFEQLMNYLDKYEKTVSDRIQFYRLISIEKVTIAEHRSDLETRRERVQKRKVDKKGRSI